MKKIWPALSFFVLLPVFCLFFNRIVQQTINNVLDNVDECEWQVDQRAFEAARNELATALTMWEEKSRLLSLAFTTGKVNSITAQMNALLERLALEETREFKVDNALLVSSLTQMLSEHEISWEAVL